MISFNLATFASSNLPTFEPSNLQTLIRLDIALFAVFILAYAFTVCWFAEQAEAMLRTVSCDCGQHSVDVLVVDDAQADNVARCFTEQCPICRCNARSATFEATADSQHSPTDSQNSPAVKEHAA